MIGATNIVKNSDKNKYMDYKYLKHSVYGIEFDRECSWSFGNEFARNSIIFGVDNSSSSHTDNHKNNFLVLV